MKQPTRSFAFPALVTVLALGFIISSQARTFAQGAAPGGEASNMRLVGYHDLQGRESLEVHVRSNDANGSWAYVGHSNNYWDGKEGHMNSITGKIERNGTSILDVSDPANPKLVWHIPNERDANSRHVSVVYDYQGTGRDYLARSSDDGGENMIFQIFDITTRDSDPSQIKLVSEIRGTPENSCGVGCGGRFIYRAHKGYWSEDSGYYYTSAGEPGFRSALIQIWDLKDPANPKFVSRLWLPGQKRGELGYEDQYAHHPIVDEENHRVYAGFRQGSGHAAAFDISTITNPKLVWAVDTSPPARGPHTVSPIVYDEVPNFKAPDLPRTYALVTDEASGGPDMAPCRSGVRAGVIMFDITYESHPFPIETWKVPTGNFCEKGGRFGPHQHAETRNGRINRFEDKLAWVAYFNAGVRVLDISDPYNLREVGYYIPKENQNSHPMQEGQPTAIQTNDVDVDHRGLGYITDRVGTGLFILEYTGPAAGATE